MIVLARNNKQLQAGGAPEEWGGEQRICLQW